MGIGGGGAAEERFGVPVCLLRRDVRSRNDAYSGIDEPEGDEAATTWFSGVDELERGDAMLAGF